MGVLSLYLTRLFLGRFAFILAGLVSLMLVLDFLSESDEVIKSGGGGADAMLHYMWLRLPQILSRSFPMAVLLGALVTMAGLARNSEITAMKAAGVSQLGLMLALAPAAVMVALPQFWIDDRLVPPAVEALRIWGVGDYEPDFARDPQGNVWLRHHGDIVRIHSIDLARQVLGGVTIFRRDPQGRVEREIQATRALPDNGGWMLYDVTVTDPAAGEVQRLDHMAWRRAPSAGALLALASHPREMPLSQLRRFASQTGTAAGPDYLYAVWLNKRLAMPVATMLILFLAIPLVQGFSRRAGMAAILAVGIAIGFLYFTLDGLVLALGEAGLLPPVLAAWGPTLVFAAVAGTIAVQYETR